MTYTHLTTDELVMIEAYFHQNTRVTIITERLNLSRQADLQCHQLPEIRAYSPRLLPTVQENKKYCRR